MNRLFERLRKIRPGYLGKPVNVQKIILAQKELAQNRNAPLPEGFLEFLHRCNGISYDGAGIFGIAPEGRIFLDIVPANQMSPFSGRPELVYSAATNSTIWLTMPNAGGIKSLTKKIWKC